MSSPTPSPPPKREIFLIVYQDRIAVPAHWAIFVPEENGSSYGTKIHAIGTLFFGYGLEIKLSYDLNGTKRRHITILLGHVDEDKVPDLEEVAKMVPTSGISKTPLDPSKYEHCQHWLRKYVDRLVQKKLMEENVSKVLEEAFGVFNGAV